MKRLKITPDNDKTMTMYVDKSSCTRHAAAAAAAVAAAPDTFPPPGPAEVSKGKERLASAERQAPTLVKSETRDPRDAALCCETGKQTREMPRYLRTSQRQPARRTAWHLNRGYSRLSVGRDTYRRVSPGRDIVSSSHLRYPPAVAVMES
ncbi:unnamed protein product [Merluccius merluccius]